VLVHVVRHPVETEIVVATGEVRVGAGDAGGEGAGPARGIGTRPDESGDQLCLLVTTLPPDTGGLDHAHDDAVRIAAAEDGGVQVRGGPAPVEGGRVQEGVVLPVARGQQHQVVRLAPTVGEQYAVAVEALDVGHHSKVPVPQVVQHQG